MQNLKVARKGAQGPRCDIWILTHSVLSGTLSVITESKDTKRDYRVVPEWTRADWSKRLDMQAGGTGFQFKLAKPVPGTFRAFDRKEGVKRIKNDESELNGKFALVERGPKGPGAWSYAEIAKEAKAAKAAGVIIVNNDEDHPDSVVEMQEEKTFVDIPVLMVSCNEGGKLLNDLECSDQCSLRFEGRSRPPK